jgi:hypothetical protein
VPKNRMMVLLATVVAVVLSAAATALAASPSASNHPAPKGNPAKNNKDFAGLVEIGGGRQMYLECQGKGHPTVVFVSGRGDRTETWTTTLDASEQAVLLGSALRGWSVYLATAGSVGCLLCDGGLFFGVDLAALLVPVDHERRAHYGQHDSQGAVDGRQRLVDGE